MITNGRSTQQLLGICFAPGRAEQESKMKQTELPLLEAREIQREKLATEAENGSGLETSWKGV